MNKEGVMRRYPAGMLEGKAEQSPLLYWQEPMGVETARSWKLRQMIWSWVSQHGCCRERTTQDVKVFW